MEKLTATIIVTIKNGERRKKRARKIVEENERHSGARNDYEEIIGVWSFVFFALIIEHGVVNAGREWRIVFFFFEKG